MSGQTWGVVAAAFLASAVEFVEAFTIVLAAGVSTNWRSAFAGTAGALFVLAALVGIFGTALVHYVPLGALRVAVGLLLVLFGLRWLKKAVLRYGGIIHLHDEKSAFQRELAALRAQGVDPGRRLHPFGVTTAFKGVLLEGLEVAFVVISFGTQAGGIGAATAGAGAACLAVVGLGALVRAPLQRVPENALKFAVGLLLTSFGTFWGGEGAGIRWYREDLFIPVLLVLYLLVAAVLVALLRRRVAAAGATGERRAVPPGAVA
jgi:uncharacterized membrane protein